MLDRLKWFLDEAVPKIGKYEVVREIGRGGMGIVYEAVDPDLGRTVAVKVLKNPDPERLRREAAAAAKLRHPNIVVIHEVGPDFIAMEYVAGGTPDALPPAARLRALEAVARAIAAAHRAGVAHLDLKPGNILVTPDGRAVVTDFGLAGARGAVAGTPPYMAPEQERGEGGPASDVYALGVMLRDLAPGLAARATAPDPASRPSAQELADALRRQFERGLRRRRAVAALAAVALLAAGAGLWKAERDSRIAAVRAQAETALRGALEVRRAGGGVGRMKTFLPPLEAAYQAAPPTAEGEYLMGRMYRALQEEDRALEFQERALARDPDFEKALYERAVLRSQRYARELQRSAEGPPPDLGALREAIVRDLRRLSGNVVARGMLAYYLGDLEEARSILREVVAKDPHLEEAWETLALVARAEYSPEREDRQRRWREAEDLLTEAIERDRGYVAHLFARSALRHERGSWRKDHGQDPLPDYAAAEADAARALAIDPGSAEAWMRRGLVRTQRAIYRIKIGGDPREDLAGAEADLTAALERDDAHLAARIWRGNVRSHRGAWLARSGRDPEADFEAADRDLTEALRRAPDSADALMRRGRLRSWRGMPEEAEKDFAESLRRAPRNVWAWTWRGAARARAGDLDGAESCLSEAIAVQRTHAEAWELRGRVRRDRAERREKAGDREAARRDCMAAAADWLEAVTLNPGLEASLGPALREARQKAAELIE